MKTIKRKDVIILIDNTQGKIFGVQFIKKDGSVRDMVCRIEVSKGVKGIGLKYNPSSKGLRCVFDMKKDAFRMINLNTVISLKIEGQSYIVQREEE